VDTFVCELRIMINTDLLRARVKCGLADQCTDHLQTKSAFYSVAWKDGEDDGRKRRLRRWTGKEHVRWYY